MYLNPFKREEALPLRSRRIWRYPRCDAIAASDANNPKRIGATCDANLVAKSNAAQPVAIAANQHEAFMLLLL